MDTCTWIADDPYTESHKQLHSQTKALKENLAPHGYFEVTHPPGLWQHITCPISFSLVVNYFGVKYIDKADADHLIAELKII